mmetsp:Transcript_3329/g.8273  ORF Transcript_3329/g.8273 Transcript_3329/m.8273 type:complete len:216 (+) Transcript_3329:308-955(+)
MGFIHSLYFSLSDTQRTYTRQGPVMLLSGSSLSPACVRGMSSSYESGRYHQWMCASAPLSSSTRMYSCPSSGSPLGPNGYTMCVTPGASSASARLPPSLVTVSLSLAACSPQLSWMCTHGGFQMSLFSNSLRHMLTISSTCRRMLAAAQSMRRMSRAFLAACSRCAMANSAPCGRKSSNSLAGILTLPLAAPFLPMTSSMNWRRPMMVCASVRRS